MVMDNYRVTLQETFCVTRCVMIQIKAANRIIAAAASEPEANKRGSSLISRRLHYRGLQLLFLTKRKILWLCASGRFRMRSGMRKELWLCASGRYRMRSGMRMELWL